MSEHTSIQWCDHTFNPWEGCTKRRRTSEANWKQPLKWNRAEYRRPQARRPRVFCASLADWLDDEVPIEWLANLLQLIFSTPRLTWLLLSKRPENWAGRLFKVWDDDHCKYGARPWIRQWLDGYPPVNVWMGTSVEDQQRANERIPDLLKIPAKVRFLSCEPLLGPIDLVGPVVGVQAFPLGMGIQWVIFGGESGKGARPCNVDWIRDGVRQCRAAGVAPFVKQLGAKVVCGTRYEEDIKQWPGFRQQVHQVTNYCDVRLRDKKGGDMSEWPEDLRIREFPQGGAGRSASGPLRYIGG